MSNVDDVDVSDVDVVDVVDVVDEEGDVDMCGGNEMDMISSMFDSKVGSRTTSAIGYSSANVRIRQIVELYGG